MPSIAVQYASASDGSGVAFSFQGPGGVGGGAGGSGGIIATYSPFGNIETIRGMSHTFSFTGGFLGNAGVSIDIPTGNGFWQGLRNFSVTLNLGFGGGAGGFYTITHTGIIEIDNNKNEECDLTTN